MKTFQGFRHRLESMRGRAAGVYRRAVWAILKCPPGMRKARARFRPLRLQFRIGKAGGKRIRPAFVPLAKRVAVKREAPPLRHAIVIRRLNRKQSVWNARNGRKGV